MRIITNPTLEPLTVAEVKSWLGVKPEQNTLDDIIKSRIVRARQYAETYMQRALLKQTIEVRYDNFGMFPVKLPYPNLITVNTVKYIDEAGVLQTLNATNYYVDDYSPMAKISLSTTGTWPNTKAEPNAVRVQYDAGYGTVATSIPEIIKEALFIIIGNWMNNQPQVESGVLATRVPYAARDMLDQYAVVDFG